MRKIKGATPYEMISSERSLEMNLENVKYQNTNYNMYIVLNSETETEK